MTEGITALLVHENSETLATLKGALERQGMHVLHAGSHAQARRVLTGLNPAQLVFTDTQLPDGTWADVLAVAEKASEPVNVIVVSRIVDTSLYVETIQTGAFDFLAPPFVDTDLAHVVRGAIHNVIARRAAQRYAPHTAQQGQS
ncbi:MAG: response regulator [Terriglobia bacterium]|jgi:DNA-binding NtrC family response regulator